MSATETAPPLPHVQLLRVPEVAAILQVSVRAVESLIANGELRPLWVGGQRRFHPTAIDAFLKSPERTRRPW